ncbi:Ger(x)C family germination protein [Bacillus mesophilus]|uniref:Ger(X)C family spore germination protein n=1 Tax=Bacillus mesophilus TaxID=1808955 RepID=A0A6M0QD11_9BACI|nr:Ger(x)C family spore germination protein [Bacillus mesophilus]MBM7663041.1 Ger(x)C family germination protein [Bacillus mesophilus]NEY73639.1 Ger(x)C family spore germination protein [Bacillus mesophilus]
MCKIFMLFLCVLVLSGCWDRSEVNDVAFVIATGFDKVEENKFQVSVQVPLPGAMGDGASGGGGGTSGGPYYVDSGIGRNVRESNDDLQKRMSRELYFGHRRVLVFGEKMARGGFQKSLEVVLEQPQSRLSSYVLLTDGEALKILNGTPHLEQLPAEAIREMAKSMNAITVKDVLNDLERHGKDPVIPKVDVVETQNGDSKDKKDEFKLNGFGILKHDHLKFFTNKQETSGAMWLLEKFPGSNYTFSLGEKDEINVYINNQRTQINSKVIDGMPTFTINIKVNAHTVQNEPKLDLEKQEEYKLATGKMEEQIKAEVTEILEHSTSEGIDMAGLGWHLFRHEIFLWEEKWKDNWEKLLPDLKIDVKVNAEIERTINSGINIKE